MTVAIEIGRDRNQSSYHAASQLDFLKDLRDGRLARLATGIMFVHQMLWNIDPGDKLYLTRLTVATPSRSFLLMLN
jgi:hypothetical protein